ncbi:hypothetical protein SUSAZ_10635 [Sulfolobus acidocaldarius SUSAZ]|nr:hypothetical protein SUSAZ_10635 [Sulfolobus acidocaldarius SUSAZ]
MKLEEEILKFLKDMSAKEEELEFLIINLFKPQLENKGIKLGKIRREYVVDDTGVLHIGYVLPIMYYEEGDKVYLFVSKNFADYGAIEQLLVREKLLSGKFNKPILRFLVAFTIPKRYYELASKMGIIVIAQNIIE